MQASDPLRLFFLCLAGGYALAALFVGGLLATDPGHLGAMLRGADMAPLPTLMLWFFLGLGFAAGQWGTALALIAQDGE